MSSLSRTIRRQSTRDTGRALLAAERIKCPKCGKKLKRRGLSFRKAQCPHCGWQGRLK